jgi:hypothetical protein
MMRLARHDFLRGCLALLLGFNLTCEAALPASPTPAQRLAEQAEGGILFSCAGQQVPGIVAGMADYLRVLEIRQDLVRVRSTATGGLLYTLQYPQTPRGTRWFKYSAELAPGREEVMLPTGGGQLHAVQTVSRKEIVLALLYRGRLTEFKAGSCSVQSLKDHVGVRQNTVAWAEQLELGWPDGDYARWNPHYWSRGRVTPGHSLHEAVNDVFMQQSQYAVGCYAATKLVMIQGVLDYYHRIKPDAFVLQAVERQLLSDGEPLDDVEPVRMWDFEPDFSRLDHSRPGKILDISYGVPADNFVPGDWIYLLNTDPTTYGKTGYEGSNAIYLGQDRFDDYYNDNDHAYSFREKLSEVYQWRYGVFSRSRDAANIVPLSPDDFSRLSRTPQEGGLLLDFRVSHRMFDGH